LTISCLLLVLVVLLGATSSGCQRPKKKRFNNDIARANVELRNKAKSFYKAIKPLSEGKQVTVADVRGPLKSVENTVKQFKKDYARMRAPANSPNGETLLTSYREFLDKQQEIIDTCFKPIVDAIGDDQTYPTPQAKWDAIASLMKKADSLEKAPYRALAKAQKDYAEAHNFNLVE
jgi:hypothetical protein